MHLRTAVIQLNSRDNPAENLAAVERFLDHAAGMGAQLVGLPEFWTYLGPYAGFAEAAQTIPGPAIERLQEKARRHRMIVHGGSIIERHPDLNGKFYNTSVLINRNGEISARYRKIHLFDVDLANGEKHHESERIAPGNEIVTAEVDGVTFGLTVCYDLRFPELFRARAIENLCYVVAPAHVGKYPPNRECFGRSMIVDPWGLVLAQAQDMPTVIMADIDLAQIERARAQLPALEHRRPEIYSAAL